MVARRAPPTVSNTATWQIHRAWRRAACVESEDSFTEHLGRPRTKTKQNARFSRLKSPRIEVEMWSLSARRSCWRRFADGGNHCLITARDVGGGEGGSRAYTCALFVALQLSCNYTSSRENNTTSAAAAVVFAAFLLFHFSVDKEKKGMGGSGGFANRPRSAAVPP